MAIGLLEFRDITAFNSIRIALIISIIVKKNTKIS